MLVKSILLVDDNAAIRSGLRREFERAGWVVCGEAGSGQEGIDKAQQLRPQLILLDLSMPGMNGLAAARHLKRVLPEVNIILFTGHGDLFKAGEANAAGISAVFSKEQPIASLLEKANVLASHNGVLAAGTHSWLLETMSAEHAAGTPARQGSR